MTIVPRTSRVLIVVGWSLTAAGFSLYAEQAIRENSSMPWNLAYVVVSMPLSLFMVAAGWWFIGSVAMSTPDGARLMTRAAAAFGVAAALQSSATFAQYVSIGVGAGGAVYQSYEWLTGLGPALVFIGFLTAALSLRAAVLNLPGVVGDVVPDLAQGEPEGPAPVGPAGS